MAKPIFIDLTEVRNNYQRYVTLNMIFIERINSQENTIIMDDGCTIEVTEESMQKLLDVIEDESLLVGSRYKLPEEK